MQVLPQALPTVQTLQHANALVVVVDDVPNPKAAGRDFLSRPLKERTLGHTNHADESVDKILYLYTISSVDRRTGVH
jgi:hypothetical protein